MKKPKAYTDPDDVPIAFAVMPEEGPESGDIKPVIVGRRLATVEVSLSLPSAGRVGSSAKGDAHACVESW